MQPFVSPMEKTVLLIGAFDTKGEEFAFVRELIEARGLGVLLMDTGVMGEPAGVTPDIPAREVAIAGGRSLAQLRSAGDRGEAVDVMIEGVSKLTPQLYNERRFDGVLSLGGGAGTNVATAAMRELPVGVPKVMVSTLASSDVSAYVGVSDITMMFSVTDIAGLNPVSRRVLANGAGAVCGMVTQGVPPAQDKPLIAATMFGVTTGCVTQVRKLLEKGGYELLIFHATGTGGRAMEALITDGYFAGVADITTTEWADQVVGGVSSLDAPGKPFYDPLANQMLFDSLREHTGAHVRVIESGHHINDPEFAAAIAQQLLSLV